MRRKSSLDRTLCRLRRLRRHSWQSCWLLRSQPRRASCGWEAVGGVVPSVHASSHCPRTPDPSRARSCPSAAPRTTSGPDLPPGCSRPGRAEPGLAGGCAPVRLGPDVRLTRRRHPRTAARQRFARRRAAVPRARRSTPPPGARGPSPRLRCEPPGTKPPSAPCCRSVTSSMPTRSSPTSTTSTGSPQVWACNWRGRTMDTLPEAEPPTQHHPFP